MQKYLEKIFTDRLTELNYLDPGVKIVFEKPKQELHGDLSTNIAMSLAKKLKQRPLDIAKEIAKPFINGNEYISKVEVANPGFINISFREQFFINKLEEILNKRDEFGKSVIGANKKAQVEFVSANPTGMLHLGHGRQAAIGDTVSNLLSWVGYNVTREYYFNNAGRQMKVLSESVFARYRQIIEPDYPFPEEGYFGDYIKDIAKKIFNEKGDKLRDSKDLTFFKEYAESFLFEEIKKTLTKMDVHHDVFYNEDSLYKSGKITEVIDILKEKGLAYEKDGAVWFAAEKIDPNLEPRVIVKSSGEPTYRLPDIAYHREKFRRGFDLIIDIFGADHIATYPDVQAGLKALGYSTESLKIMIHQFVTLVKDGEVVKMSKRNADMVTLDELIDEVGKDAVRYFLVMRSCGSHLEFDLTLAKEQSDKNPVYYLQYAHARISSVIRFAESEGLAIDNTDKLRLLKEKEEIDLIRELSQFPYVVESAAVTLEPHRITTYLFDLASFYHKFYHDHRVVSEDKDLSCARLALCVATKTVLANGFKILGVSAPERM
jgi:arginyl-tRNA synthetase